MVTSILNILKESIPSSYLELNQKAFEIGLNMVEGMKKFSI